MKYVFYFLLIIAICTAILTGLWSRNTEGPREQIQPHDASPKPKTDMLTSSGNRRYQKKTFTVLDSEYLNEYLNEHSNPQVYPPSNVTSPEEEIEDNNVDIMDFHEEDEFEFPPPIPVDPPDSYPSNEEIEDNNEDMPENEEGEDSDLPPPVPVDPPDLQSPEEKRIEDDQNNIEIIRATGADTESSNLQVPDKVQQLDEEYLEIQNPDEENLSEGMARESE